MGAPQTRPNAIRLKAVFTTLLRDRQSRGEAQKPMRVFHLPIVKRRLRRCPGRPWSFLLVSVPFAKH
jgi:hypothetical protein